MHWVCILLEENSTRVWPSLADMAQNFQGLSTTTNKRVMSTFQNWFKTSELELKHTIGPCGGHQNYMCVEFGGAMESMNHEQKMSRVKQVEGV